MYRMSQTFIINIQPVLWNRNYLLRFRFWLLKSYGSGSGSNFWKVMVPVPLPTFEKVAVPVSVPASYLDHKKSKFLKKFGIFFDFLLSKLFYKEKVHKFQQIYGKMWMKKMFNEGNQIHNFMFSSGSGTVNNYGFGSGSCSTSQKVTVPTVPVPVPVPQHWYNQHFWRCNIRMLSGNVKLGCHQPFLML